MQRTWVGPCVTIAFQKIQYRDIPWQPFHSWHGWVEPFLPEGPTKDLWPSCTCHSHRAEWRQRSGLAVIAFSRALAFGIFAHGIKKINMASFTYMALHCMTWKQVSLQEWHMRGGHICIFVDCTLFGSAFWVLSQGLSKGPLPLNGDQHLSAGTFHDYSNDSCGFLC